MEFASLQDAFPNIGNEEDTSKKKKSHKGKEGFQAYELPPTDADRPATVRMLEVPPMRKPTADQEDEYVDESTQFQKRMTVNNTLPSPPSTNSLKTQATPSFFGAEAFTNPSDDAMAPFTKQIHKSSGYMLDADFTKSFDQPGFGKSSGSTLPVPELRQRWKPLSADRVDTAYTGRSSRNSDQFNGLDTGDMAAMKAKIDSLMARLDDFEHRAEGANPQLEMLSFIMTGLFLMFVLDISVRKSSGMRLMNVR
jgi:hypothetical protein